MLRSLQMQRHFLHCFTRRAICSYLLFYIEQDGRMSVTTGDPNGSALCEWLNFSVCVIRVLSHLNINIYSHRKLATRFGSLHQSQKENITNNTAKQGKTTAMIDAYFQINPFGIPNGWSLCEKAGSQSKVLRVVQDWGTMGLDGSYWYERELNQNDCTVYSCCVPAECQKAELQTVSFLPMRLHIWDRITRYSKSLQCYSQRSTISDSEYFSQTLDFSWSSIWEDIWFMINWLTSMWSSFVLSLPQLSDAAVASQVLINERM